MDEISVKVHSFGEGRNLSLVWYDPITGKKCARSAGTRDFDTASRAAGALEKELNDGTYCKPSRLTWAEFRKRYEAERLGGDTPEKTRNAYVSALNHVTRVLNPGRLCQVTTRAVARLQQDLRQEGMGETTIRRHLRHIRAALAWAHEQGLLAVMPTIKRPKDGGRKLAKGRAPTLEEFERMLKATRESRPDDARVWRRYLRGLWLSGLRLEESLILSWDDDAPFRIDLTGRRPVFVIRGESQKSRKDEVLPMTPDFAQWLLRTQEGRRVGRVFDFRNTEGEPLAVNSVSRIVRKIGKKARVVVDRSEKIDAKTGKRVEVVRTATAHDLRRAFCTRWAKRVMPPTLRRLARHASVQTTMAYYVHLDAQELGEELWAAWGGPATGNKKGDGNKVGNIGPKRPQETAKGSGVQNPETPYQATT